LSLRYGVLCLLALLIIVFMAFKDYETWTAPLEVTPEKTSPKKPSVKSEGVQNRGGPSDSKATPAIASYIFVADKNPFHPDRKEFPVVAPPTAPPPEPPPVRPQVTLFGVTMAGDYKSASISYPGRALQKGEREVMTAKIGDPVGQFRLVKILPDRIGLEHPKDSFEVFLYDARTPKKRVAVKTENKPATVTSTVPGAGAPAGPEGAKPGQPPTASAPVKEGIAAAPMPVPVTPAGIPGSGTSRTRRFFGSRPAGEN
jgi:hypothetical protein